VNFESFSAFGELRPSDPLLEV